MTHLSDSHALIQMARARGLHVVVEHAGEAPVTVLVYPTPSDQRAVVTWQRDTGLVCRGELGWVSCSLAEATEELEHMAPAPTPASAPADRDLELAAFIGDMVRPLKRAMPGYKAVEAQVEQLAGSRLEQLVGGGGAAIVTPELEPEPELCGCDEAAWWRAAYERERAKSARLAGELDVAQSMLRTIAAGRRAQAPEAEAE